jgi:hypothetical protein
MDHDPITHVTVPTASCEMLLIQSGSLVYIPHTGARYEVLRVEPEEESSSSRLVVRPA